MWNIQTSQVEFTIANRMNLIEETREKGTVLSSTRFRIRLWYLYQCYLHHCLDLLFDCFRQRYLRWTNWKKHGFGDSIVYFSLLLYWPQTIRVNRSSLFCGLLAPLYVVGECLVISSSLFANGQILHTWWDD